MCARVAAGLLVLASAAFGEVKVVVELVPDRPGPYVGSESVTVDVWLHSQLSFDTELWQVQLDFSDSDQALGLDPTFTFDLSSSIAPEDFEVHPELPIPWTANWFEYGCPPCFLQLPGGGSLHIGSMGVQLPSDDGVYRLDALNADEADPTRGAMVDGGIGRAFTGEITAPRFEFVVAPQIPAVSEWGLAIMLVLLLAAGSIVIRGTNHRTRLLAG